MRLKTPEIFEPLDESLMAELETARGMIPSPQEYFAAMLPALEARSIGAYTDPRSRI